MNGSFKNEYTSISDVGNTLESLYSLYFESSWLIYSVLFIDGHPLSFLLLYCWISGLLIGRFYSETGQPTEALLQAQASLAEGQRLKAQSAAEMLRFPACNSQWSAAEGGRVWCSTKRCGNSSGLIKHEQSCVDVLACNRACLTLAGFIGTGLILFIY